jgi:hypothetical protein
MAQIDPALEKQVFNIAQAERKPNVHQDNQLDYLRRRVKISEWVSWFSRTWHAPALPHRAPHRQRCSCFDTTASSADHQGSAAFPILIAGRHRRTFRPRRSPPSRQSGQSATDGRRGRPARQCLLEFAPRPALTLLPTAVRTIFHLVPITRPFFAPCKGPLARFAYLFRQV